MGCAVASGADVITGRGRRLSIRVGPTTLPVWLLECDEPQGLSVLAVSRGDGDWEDESLRTVAEQMHRRACTVCCIDLVSQDEGHDPLVTFDVPLLAERLSEAVNLCRLTRVTGSTPVAVAAWGNAAAAAMWVAAETGAVSALVSIAGRPHLAEPRLGKVSCPALLLVSEQEERLLHVNRMAHGRLGPRSVLKVIPDRAKTPRSDGSFVKELLDWFDETLLSNSKQPSVTAGPSWKQLLMSSRLVRSVMGAVTAVFWDHSSRG